MNWFYHTSGVAVVTQTDRPKSVRNRCVIEVFGGVFVLSCYFLDFSVGVGTFCRRTKSDLFLFSHIVTLCSLYCKNRRINSIIMLFVCI